MMIIKKMSYIFGRNAGECSFLGLYSMENIGEWAVFWGAWIKIKSQNFRYSDKERSVINISE